MNTLIPDPEVDCWDYAFAEGSTHKLWVCHPKSSPDTVVTYNPHSMWRYLVTADRQEWLVDEVVKLTRAEGTDITADDLICEQVTLGEVLNGWRLIRYNGQNVCATESADFSPTNPSAWPGGPMAPVRNGWAYIALDKQTFKPYGKRLPGDSEVNLIPVAEPTINKLIDTLCDPGAPGVDSIPAEEIFDRYWIVAENLLNLAMDWPVVFWSGRLLPLYPIMNLNPNHTGDPEEIALSTIDSQA